jgi:hypothetical protein
MSEQEIREILLALLTGEPVALGERGSASAPLFEAVATFEEASVSSDEVGLVITTGDGSEFRVTVARSD